MTKHFTAWPTCTSLPDQADCAEALRLRLCCQWHLQRVEEQRHLDREINRDIIDKVNARAAAPSAVWRAAIATDERDFIYKFPQTQGVVEILHGDVEVC